MQIAGTNFSGSWKLTLFFYSLHRLSSSSSIALYVLILLCCDYGSVQGVKSKDFTAIVASSFGLYSSTAPLQLDGANINRITPKREGSSLPLNSDKRSRITMSKNEHEMIAMLGNSHPFDLMCALQFRPNTHLARCV